MNQPVTLSSKWTRFVAKSFVKWVFRYSNIQYLPSSGLTYSVNLKETGQTDWYSGLRRRKPFPIYRIVLNLYDSVVSKVLASCLPAVHLSFDGIEASTGRNIVKDESGNNNSAIMTNDVQVDQMGGKCGGAVSLNGMGFE